MNHAEFVWRERAPSAELQGQLESLQQRLGYTLPVGYTSECHTQLGVWFKALAASLRQGVLLFIDYGYPRREYYHPQRQDGTLLCHYRHRVHSDPLILPGLQDITASVDFTAVAEAGMAAGLELSGYTSQNYFLFGCGLEELLVEVDPQDQQRYLALSQQVKKLTLPGEMGDRFKAIAFSRGITTPLQGFSFYDERQRL